MQATSFADTRFPTGRCETCAREVLTYAAFDATAFEIRLCVHCDGLVETVTTTGTELTRHGYEIVEPSSCGSSGCGGGSCGRS